MPTPKPQYLDDNMDWGRATCPPPTSKHVCHFYDCVLIKCYAHHYAHPPASKEQDHPQPQPQPQPSHNMNSFIVG